MERASNKHIPLYLNELVKGELQANGKQEQNNPDFGNSLNLVHSLDKTESTRPGSNPHQDKTDQSGYPGAVTTVKHYHGKAGNYG